MISKIFKKVFKFIFPDDAPTEKIPLLYYHIFKLYRFFKSIIIVSLIPKSIEIIVSYLSPAWSCNLDKKDTDKILNKSFYIVSFLVFILTLVVQGLWSFGEGTFRGSNNDIFYFWDDKLNILNYFFIVPLYMALGIRLVSLTIDGFGFITNFFNRDELSDKKMTKPKGSIIYLFFFIIVLSIAITINYMHEILDTSLYLQHFWCITKISSSGERIFSGLGIYYTLLTYNLLLVSLFVVISYLSIFLITINYGSKIKNEKILDTISLSEFKGRLSYFVNINLVAKAIAAIYMLNALTWKYQSTLANKDTLNLQLFVIALAFLGLFVISIPRYYIELEIYSYQVSKVGEPNNVVYNDLRPRNVKIITNVLDWTIIAIFTKVFFSI